MHMRTFVGGRSSSVLLAFLLLILLTGELGILSSGHVLDAFAAENVNGIFAQAAHDFSVPAPLLKALCYMEGRLSNHGGTASIDQGYGCMHLVKNRHSATLEQAAHDLRVSEDRLKTDLATNIRGGAAVLRDYQRQLSDTSQPTANLDSWDRVLLAYSAASSPAVARMYADALYKILRTGFVGTSEKGDLVTLAPQPVLLQHVSRSEAGPQPRHIGVMQLVRAVNAAVGKDDGLPNGCVDDGSTDYPGAINCIVQGQKFDCNRVADKAACTYEGASRPAEYPVNFVVIHDIEGSALDAINTFHDVNSSVSVHYVVDSDGTVYQMVHDTDIAYHAGNYWYNQRSVGIEHAGYAANGYQWYNATEYLSSARLTAYLLKKFHIPLDRAHVLGHGNVPAPTLALTPNHVDPGPYWLWDYYMDLIKHLGIAPAPSTFRPTIIAAHQISVGNTFDASGQEDPTSAGFFNLYTGPSTRSGLIPHAGSDVTDETSNIEAGVSYAYSNVVMDAAGSGAFMYQIWYGAETHLHNKKPSYLANACQVWLAAKPGTVTYGSGLQVSMKSKTKIYSKPAADDTYQIGDAPGGAVFVSVFSLQDDDGDWFEINFNHRQAWIPVDAVSF